MRAGGLLLVLLGASGCTTVWTMRQPAPSGEPHEVTDGKPCDTPAQALADELERRLTAVEEQLRAIDEVDGVTEAAELREERLLLLVELQQLGEALAPGSCGESTAPLPDHEALLAHARERLVASRDAGREGRGPDDGWRFKSGKDDALVVDLVDGERADGKPLAPTPVPAELPETKEEATAEEGEGGEDDFGGLLAGVGGQGAPAARAAAAVVAEAEQPLDLMPAVRRRAAAMGDCFTVAERQRGITVQVVARLAVDGSLHVLRLTAEAGLTPAASDCLVAALEPVRVPTVGRSRVVTFPLILSGD